MGCSTQEETPLHGDGNFVPDLGARINMDFYEDRGYALAQPSFQPGTCRPVHELFTKPNALFEVTNAVPANRGASSTLSGKFWLRQEFPSTPFPTGYALHDRKDDPTWGPEALRGTHQRTIRHLRHDDENKPDISVFVFDEEESHPLLDSSSSSNNSNFEKLFIEVMSSSSVLSKNRVPIRFR